MLNRSVFKLAIGLWQSRNSTFRALFGTGEAACAMRRSNYTRVLMKDKIGFTYNTLWTGAYTLPAGLTQPGVYRYICGGALPAGSMKMTVVSFNRRPQALSPGQAQFRLQIQLMRLIELVLLPSCNG